MTDQPQRPADYQQRQRALEPLQSFCVTAPAGSGKTELLIQRYLTLLARVNDAQEVLAITFTRKAAAEMRERVYGALERAHNLPQPVDANGALTWQLATAVLQRDQLRDQQKQWRLLDNPGVFNIKTIDSYCSSLTRQMPVLSNFGGPVSPVDNAGPYYLEATQALLDFLETGHPQSEDLGALMLHFDNNWPQLEALFSGMLAKRDQWLPFTGSGLQDSVSLEGLRHSVSILIGDHLQQLATLLAPYAGELKTLLDYSLKNLQHDPVDAWPLPEPSELGLWQRFADLLLTGSNGWRLKVDKRQGFPAGAGEPTEFKQRLYALIAELEVQPGLLAELCLLRTLPTADQGGEEWQLTLAMGRVLPILAAQLTVVFQQHGVVDHVQVALAAQQALGSDDNPTELSMRLDYTLSHILLDEFQDTAVNQYTLVQRLTRGWLEHNEANPDNPRTFFIVGDGMQSIYGFRDANVGLFMSAREAGFNGVRPELLELSANFRSEAPLVEWVNDSFRQAFPDQDNLPRCEIAFSPAHAQKANGAQAQVLLRAFDLDDDPQRLAESQDIVALLQAGLADPECESLAVLVRSRSHLIPIIRALKLAGIPWHAEEIDALAKSAVVIDLLNLCDAVHNSADDVAWAALLRGPWCGLSLSDMHIVASNVGGDNWWQAILTLTDGSNGLLSDVGQTQLDFLVAQMAPALVRRQQQPLQYLLEELWLALGGPQIAAACGELEDAAALFALLGTLDSGGGVYDRQLLLERVARLYAPGTNADSKLQLMTLHKSKGLEFDWVVIPALERGTAADKRQMLLWNEYHSSDLRTAFLLAMDDRKKTQGSLYQFLRDDQARKQRLEATRLLYVGCTRAISRLYLSAGIKLDAKAEAWKEPGDGSLLHSLWPVFSAQAKLLAVAGPIESPEPIPADLRLRLIQPLSQPPAVMPANTEANIPAIPGNPMHRHVGTMVHVSLQRLSALDSTELANFDSSAYDAWWQTQLQQLGVDRADLSEACALVQQSVNNVLGDSRGRHIVSSEREQAQSEYAISSLRSDGRLAEYIVDRTYLEDGVRWIIDYKSSSPAVGETLEDFCRRESDRYAQQLTAYAQNLAAIDNKPVKCALYFTLIAHWLPL
ncbi:hypothetical protein EYC98_10760 [Halieaceae bacterium IMCC14734]|uniref:DNA 3'-5' helicase n=1 Tax=Candidatus Litorirhabdus singularis TaxID=2518993 RepID=A0ABT3TGL2_9GAMM|nr:UvrD-helicase domain-containing protein [Candidatus Litorirhabdus singularis]MCX2981345.1 hypothetical protein [Candidatus Litorirhabdus singularis]